MSRTCESCKWSRKRGDGGLECRRHPPVRTFENGVGHWEFPSVLPLDYCGDHDAEPAATASDADHSPGQSQRGTGGTPVAYAIECAPGDPKLHSLSFWKGDLQKIVTAHGGKVIPLYRK